MTDVVIAKDSAEHFWGRVRTALGALRPVRQERGPAYGQAAIARQIGMKPKLGARIEEELTRAWEGSAEAGVSMSLLVIEIDRYREYFGCYGKGATDDCVMTVMQTIADALPHDDDTCLRMGRATFVVALPDMPALMARTLAQKISKAIRGQGLAHKESHAGTVTVSVGLAVTNPQGAFDRTFFEAGAQALKKAQRKGMGRLEVVDLRPAQEQRRKAA
ncbi:diguanylate cyclase domain-containing protein [Devosia sp. ZW T5_3]|uniref:diguanylate cyclase domain-containing protein n=1 Tax=Devosia sp. ZW T5_3 TaxID=3378085 RepID=UPI003853510E